MFQILDPALVGVTPIKPTITDDGSGTRCKLEFSINEPMSAGMLLEVQASTDLWRNDPWVAIAGKDGGSAWSGPAAVSVSAPSGGKTVVTVSALQPISVVGRQFHKIRIISP